MFLKISLMLILWIIFIGNLALDTLTIGAFICVLLISLSIRSINLKLNTRNNK